jgi:DNA-binding CsgD family transcriptional regulator/sugar lactone lactonase YvrE
MPLSRREMEIARLVADGLTNRGIAGRLFISERTVDGHLEHIREKLGVNTRAQVAAWVVRQAEPSPPPRPMATVRPRRRISSRALLVVAVALVALEAVVVLALMPTPGPMIKTVAGNENVSERYPLLGDFGGNGGLAKNALLSLPSDVAVAPDGTLFIADYKNGVIRRVGGDGRISTYAGVFPNSQRSLADGEAAVSVNLGYASNLAVDSKGIVYFLTVSTTQRLQVWRIDKAGAVRLAVDLGPTTVEVSNFWPQPIGGLALAKDGAIFVSDRDRNQIWKYVPGEPRASVIAGPGVVGSLGDEGPATDASLLRPASVAYFDRTGDLYIADAGHNRIRRIDNRGIIHTVAGSGKYYGDAGDGGPAPHARLSFPYGVAVGRDGTVYIADTGNNRLRKVTVSGVIEAFAGTGDAGFGGDGGSAIGAELRGPEGITFDASGNLFIADTLNHRVREIVGVSH